MYAGFTHCIGVCNLLQTVVVVLWKLGKKLDPVYAVPHFAWSLATYLHIIKPQYINHTRLNFIFITSSTIYSLQYPLFNFLVFFFILDYLSSSFQLPNKFYFLLKFKYIFQHNNIIIFLASSTRHVCSLYSQYSTT